QPRACNEPFIDGPPHADVRSAQLPAGRHAGLERRSQDAGGAEQVVRRRVQEMAAKVVVAVGLVHVTVDDPGQDRAAGHLDDASAARDSDSLDRTDGDDSVLIDQDRSARNGFAARSVDDRTALNRRNHGRSGPQPGSLLETSWVMDTPVLKLIEITIAK